MAPQRLIVRSVQALENAIKNDLYQCSATCKGKEILRFAKGGSEGQKMMSLACPFQRRCAYLGFVRLIGGIQYVWIG